MSTIVYRIDDGGAERQIILIKQDTDTDYYPGNAPEIDPVTIITGTGNIGPDLLAIELLTGTNTIYYRSAVNTWSPVVMGSGITFSGGILSAQLTGALDPDLNSLAAASGTNTIYYRQSDNNWQPLSVGSGLSFSGGILVSSGIIGSFQPYDDDLTGLASLTGQNVLYYRTGAGLSGWAPVTFYGLGFENGQLIVTSGSIADLTGINVIHYRPNSGSWTNVKHTYPVDSPGVPPLDVYLSTTSPLSGHLLSRALFDSANSRFLNYSNGIFVVFNNTGGLGPASGSFALSILNGGTSATSATQARINLGLEIGDDVQAWDSELDALSSISQRGLYYRETGSSWKPVLPTGNYGALNYKGVVLTTGGGAYLPPNSGYLVSLGLYDPGMGEYISSYNSGFVVSNYTGGLQRPFIIDIAHGGTAATGASGARANLGLTIGLNIQGWDQDLQSLANTTGSGIIYYRSGESTWIPVTIGSGLNFISGILTSSGVFGLVDITNTTGILPVDRGGTNASTATGARANLGLIIGTDIQGWDADLDSLSNASAINTIYYRSGVNTWSPVSIGSGLSFISGVLTSSVSGEGGASQPLDGDLTSLSNASSVNAIYYRSAADMWDPLVITTGLVLANGRLYASGQASLTTIPVGNLIGTLDISQGGTSATSASEALVNLGAQPVDGDLTAISNLSGSGVIYYRSGLNTWSPVIFGSGLSFNQGTVISSGIVGSFQPLDDDLTSLSNLINNNTLYFKQSDGLWNTVLPISNRDVYKSVILSTGGSTVPYSGYLIPKGIFDSTQNSFLSIEDDLLYTSNITGGTSSLFILDITNGGTAATTASAARSNLGLQIGVDVQAYDPDLSGIAGLNSLGILYRSGTNIWSFVTIGSGLSFNSGVLISSGIVGLVDLTNTTGILPISKGGTNASTITGARSNLGLIIGTDIQAYDDDLQSLASASSTNTIYYRSATNTWSPVTISTGLNFGGGLLAVTGDGTLLTGLNASSLTIGTVPSTRGGAGTVNGILKSNGAGIVSAAVPNTDFQQSSLDLIALSSLTGSPNLYYREASGSWRAIANLGNPPLDVYLKTDGALSGHVLSRSLYNIGNNTFLAYSGTNLGIYNSDGAYDQDYILPVSHGGTNASTVAGARTSLGLVIGTNVQAYHDDLQSLSQLTQTGVIYYRRGSGDWAPVTIGSGLAFVSGTLVNSGDTLTLDGDLNALAALNGTHNIYYRSAENTWSSVQFVSGIAFVGDKVFASGSASLLNLPAANLVGVLSVSQGGTNAINASDARQELGLEIGVDVQAWDSDLHSLANANLTGIIYYRSGVGAWSPVTIGSGLGFDISNGLLIASGAIGSFQPLDDDLTSISNLTTTGTLYYRSNGAFWNPVTIGSGLSFNPSTSILISSGAIGSFQSYDSDLTSLSNTNQIGVIYYRSGEGNWSPVTIGSGLRLDSSNGLLISSGIIGGYQPLDTDLTLISNLSDSNTLYFRRNDVAWDPVLPLTNRNIYRNTILSSGGSSIPYSGYLITIGLMDRANQDFLYIEDELLYKSDITGGSNAAFILDVLNGGTSANNASQARTNLGAQAQDADLDSLAATSLTGTIYYRSGNGTWSPITVGSGLAFNANMGILTSSGIIGSFQPLDGDLTAISNLGGTHTVYHRSAADTWTPVNFVSGVAFIGDNVVASGTASLLNLPVANIVGTVAISQGGTSATSASEALTNLGGQPLDSDLTSLAAANQTGVIYYRSGAGNWSPVTIGSGLAFNANLGIITSSGAIGSFQPLDGDLTAISNLAGTHDIYHRSADNTWTSTNFISGITFVGSNVFLSGTSNLLNIPASNLIGTLSIGMGGTSANNATAALSNLGGQPIDADLTSISSLSETGIIYYRSGNGVWSPITIGSGLRFNANAGLLVSSGIIGDYQPLDADLTAIANLNGTNTIYYRSAADTWSAVTISSGLQFNNGIIIVSGNGTLLNALNGSAITQGIVSSNHGGAGTVNGILKANGAGIVSAAGANIDYQSADADLISIANTNQTGVVYYKSGDGAWSPITIGSGLRFDANNGLLVSSGVIGSFQPLDGDLTSISNLSTTNVLHYRSATDTWSAVTTTTGVVFDNGKLFASGNGSLLTTLNASNLSAGTVPSSRGGAGTINGILKADGAGNVSAAGSNVDYQAADSDLISLSNTNQTGVIYYRSGDGSWSPVTIGSGLRFNANQGILISSGGIQSLDADLNSLANLDGTTTLYFRSGNSNWGPVRPIENRDIYRSVILSTGGNTVPYSGYLIAKGIYDTTQNEFLHIIDNILYTSDITGGTSSTFILDISNGGTNAGTAGQALSNLGGQPLDTDLTSISNLSQTGIIYYRSGNGVWSPVTVGSGLAFNQNIGILTTSGINIPTGTIATQNANNVNIQGGTIQGISSLSVNGTVGISNNLNVGGIISGHGAYITGISAFNITGGDLQALENLTQTGSMFYRFNTSIWNPVIPASGLFFNSGNGELGARLGSVVQRWDGDLDALSALTGINAIYYRSATDTWNPVSFGSGVRFLNGILTFTGSGGISNTNLEVNVLNYGAVGNGIADDTSAFISAGGGVPGRRILVPGGYKYRITSTLASALASGQTWYGNGDIVTDNGFNFNVFEINNKPDITIFGLTAHGGTLGAPYSSADARFVLAYGNSSRTKVLYCNVYGFQSAALVSAPYCDLSHNTVIGTTGWGLFADEGAAGVLVSYNNVSGVKASYGIYIKGQNSSNRLKSPTVIGNNVFNGQSYGIVTNYVNDARIGFNTCSNNTFDGIFLNNASTRGKVFGNICDFNDNGIAFYETSFDSIRNEFFNNTLRQNANAGFLLNGVAPGYINANAIYDNQFESNSNYGLVTAGPSSSTFIENNRFYSESVGILSVGTGDIIESNEFVDCTEKYMGSATSIIRQYNSFTGIVLNTATGLRQLLLGSGLSVTGGTTLVASVTYALDQDLQAIENLNGTNTLYFRQSNGVWSPILPTDNRDIYKTTILSTGGPSVPYSGYLISKGIMDNIQQDFLYLEDDVLYTANLTGGNSSLFTLDLTNGGTSANTATGARSNLGLVIGTNVQAWDSDLQSLADTNLTNFIYYRSGVGVWSPVTISTGLSFVNGTLISSGRAEVINYINGGVNNIGTTDIYKHYVNTGSSLTQFLLPLATSGLGPYSFTVDDSDGIHIRANTNDVIRLGPGSITTGNGYVVSTDVGSSLTLLALNDVTWQAKSVVGYWSVS